MAQLVKLYEYVSRYETDTPRYASQYIRLKRKHWERIKVAWEQGTLTSLRAMEDEINNVVVEETKRSKFQSFKQFFQRRQGIELPEHQEGLDGRGKTEVDDIYAFPYSPDSLNELKILFLDNVFRLQVKWASSTITNKSFVDKQFYRDEWLKFFLQRFPDTYLLLYKPVFMIKNAPIEVDAIFISPTCVWCISKYKNEYSNVLVGSKERFWTE